MRFALIVCLLIQSISSYSQFYVGETKDAAKSHLQKNEIKFTESKLSDTTSRMSWMVGDMYQVILVLNANGTVTRQTIIPEKQNATNTLVKWFNKDFVIVSNTEWKDYAKGSIFKIQLALIGGEGFFTITLISDGN